MVITGSPHTDADLIFVDTDNFGGGHSATKHLMNRGCKKVAIITGAGQGIGEATARAFAAEGASVIIAEFSEQTGTAVATSLNAQGHRAQFIKTDVSKPEQCEAAAARTVAEFGKITTLANASATVSPDGNVEKIALADWQRALDVNFTGMFLMCKYVMGHIRAAGGGAVQVPLPFS